MLILGEVHTGLLQHSSSLAPALCEHVLSIVQGERVRRFERPIAYAVSPDLLAGVDCRLATATGSRVRGVGTVLHRAAITGGNVLQGAAVVRVTRAESDRRLPWSHYLASPGHAETVGRADREDLVQGFLAAAPGSAAAPAARRPADGPKSTKGPKAAKGPAPAPEPVLDLGAISGRLMDEVQRMPELDRAPPLRMARTKLRWVAVTTGESGPEPAPAGPGGPGGSAEPSGPAGPGEVTFRIEDRHLRTVRLPCPAGAVAGVAELCEDLALHDWLLTTLLEVIERSRIGSGAHRQTVARLRPAIDHLLHLWMPAARLDPTVAGLWETVERQPGFSRQWQASVNRIRDQVALSTIALLGAGPEQDQDARAVV